MMAADSCWNVISPARAYRARFLTEMVEHHRVGSAEPMRGDLLAVWPHDRGRPRETRHAFLTELIDIFGAV
ncbi:hypothetical protein [Pseudomonas sp. ZB1P45]|uniref:hypothetical protein n=1 Tax=Pseudomonas frigoris TaxID=3398356 RepID=UPI0039F04170